MAAGDGDRVGPVAQVHREVGAPQVDVKVVQGHVLLRAGVDAGAGVEVGGVDQPHRQLVRALAGVHGDLGHGPVADVPHQLFHPVLDGLGEFHGHILRGAGGAGALGHIVDVLDGIDDLQRVGAADAHRGAGHLGHLQLDAVVAAAAFHLDQSHVLGDDGQVVVQLGALVGKAAGVLDLHLLLGGKVQARQQHVEAVGGDVALHQGAAVRRLSVFVLLGDDGDGGVGVGGGHVGKQGGADGVALLGLAARARAVEVVLDGVHQGGVQGAAGGQVHVAVVGAGGDHHLDLHLVLARGGGRLGEQVVRRAVQRVDDGAVGGVVGKGVGIQRDAVHRQGGAALRHHEVLLHLGAAVVLQQALAGGGDGLFRCVRVQHGALYRVLGRVGARVSARIGARVGVLGGAQVGVLGGARVGVLGGARVGARGGVRVGARGGARVSTRGGARVGARIGARVSARIGARIGARVRARIGARIGARVSARIGARVGVLGGARVGVLGGARVSTRGGARVGVLGGARVSTRGGARVGVLGGARVSTRGGARVGVLGGIRVGVLGGDRRGKAATRQGGVLRVYADRQAQGRRQQKGRQRQQTPAPSFPCFSGERGLHENASLVASFAALPRRGGISPAGDGLCALIVRSVPAGPVPAG